MLLFIYRIRNGIACLPGEGFYDSWTKWAFYSIGDSWTVTKLQYLWFMHTVTYLQYMIHGHNVHFSALMIYRDQITESMIHENSEQFTVSMIHWEWGFHSINGSWTQRSNHMYLWFMDTVINFYNNYDLWTFYYVKN